MATKFGLFKYDTENIGDEIQSIAARRFLPVVNYWFDRDDIDSTKVNNSDTVKLIMNGWYTHKPDKWPPKNQNISPLLISMFVERHLGPDYSEEAFLTDASKNFLNKFGPVGTRDLSTHLFLKSNNIESYFSGCLTLTLNADSKIKKQDFIIAVDVSDRIYQKITSMTNRTVIRINTLRQKDLTREEKFALAEYWLFLYQSAHMVITTRLHCMLPCLALKTPVLAISGREPNRYKGLIDLTNHITEDKILNKDFSYNFDKPLQNPNTYLTIRSDLEKRCVDYTGYDSKKSFLSTKKPEELLSNTNLISAIGKMADESFKTIALGEEICQIRTELQEYKDLLEQEKQRNEKLTNIGVKGVLQNLKVATIRYIKKKF